ncbi:ABC transporter ATP-binding protein [Neglectibacter timonensis]|uniref:ABC transporter ATP-binding protein n=1 Tax=Neglectibacter timonensis TaxID=1776382 RepID=UPI0039A3A731
MIRIDHVTFSYGEESESTGGVQDINLNIEDGQFIVLCGESGCGKTTITRLINGLIPHYYEGKMSGNVWVNEAKVSSSHFMILRKTVGSVFQNPRSQFFNVDTTSEITFGCENLGQPERSIRERLENRPGFSFGETDGAQYFSPLRGENRKSPVLGCRLWSLMYLLWTNHRLTSMLLLFSI